MKGLMLAVAVLLGPLVPAIAQSPAAPCSVAGPCAALNKTLAVGLSLDPWQGYLWGGRDIYNGKFAAGYGYELADFYRNGQSFAYFSLMHVFNGVGESGPSGGGRGAIGGVLGVRPVNTLNAIAALVKSVPEDDFISLPPWLNDISNWTSVDAGYAYKLGAAPAGESRNEWIIGGKVQRRFDLADHH